MINIRYHIVSITAVFLALGIGVALGSTFLDGATVDVINRNVTNAERRIDITSRANERLRAEVEAAQERDANLTLLASEDLVASHLPDVPVLLITPPGVDRDLLDPLATVLDRTGADLRGRLELQDSLAFDGNEVDEGLAEDLGLDDPTAVELRDEVYRQLNEALVAAGQPTDEGPTTIAEGRPEILDILLDRGYLDFDAGPDLDGDAPLLDTTGYRYVMVGEPGLAPERNEVARALLPLDDDDQGGPLPTVVVAATVPPAEEGEPRDETLVDEVRADGDLADGYSTVDNADTFAGLVSVVYVLEQMDVLVPEHFGQGDGANAVLPPVP